MSSASELQRHFSASPYEGQVGYCRAVRAGDRIHVSGTAPIAADGSNAAIGDPEGQAARCLDVIMEAVAALGDGHATVVRTRVFLTRAEDWPAVGRAHVARFGAAPPACTFVVVAGLLHEEWLLEIEAEAVCLRPRG